MQFELFVSLRYLLARRKQAFISVISLISVLGVAIGVASLIVVLGVMNGFSENLRDKILGINSHLIVGSVKQTIENYDGLVDKSLKLDGIAAATPFIYYEVMLSTPTGVKGVVLRGIDPDTAGQVLSVEKDLVSGSLKNLGEPADTPGIVIGKELAARLGLTMGSRVSLLAPSGKKSAAGFSPKILFFNVVGIFNSGMYEYDSSLVFVSIPEAQKILGFEGDVVTGIEYRVTDIDAVQQTGELLIRALGGFPLYSRNWIEMNQNLFAALKLEKTAMAVILTMIVLVGSFSIITTLVMMVMEKTKDIAVLMALGATPTQIRNIFILQGSLIGAVGTSIGFGLGLAICSLLKKYQFIKLPADVYYLDHLPVKTEFLDMSLIAVSAMILCFLATLYPARQAAGMHPTEALRYE
ncbi:MAG TPA: lipoprotein-releasing ABC transporter permease subunit [Desulfomicrobium sp.]|nr:lipoprotein-releasing ABC transporter permease subunit [Desulfomicrobium sp.]